LVELCPNVNIVLIGLSLTIKSIKLVDTEGAFKNGLTLFIFCNECVLAPYKALILFFACNNGSFIYYAIGLIFSFVS